MAWTDQDETAVCSAHAEMIPAPNTPTTAWWSLLRTRGDDPATLRAENDGLKSAPHTRR